jgi:hypothetical protein
MASITIAMSRKGAVSLYGLGRFPVTLYPEQWAEVMAKGKEILAFSRDNAPKITEQQERYAAAIEVAEAKGITEGKARDEFIDRILGWASKPKVKSKASSVRSELVAELMARA